jgi:ribosomal protein S18 acetylase RimI-like enzyme
LEPEDGGSAASFGLYEAIDDDRSYQYLLAAACERLRKKGYELLRGPWHPNISYEPGILIEGFHLPCAIGTAYTPPYYLKQFESAGFERAVDLLGYSRFGFDLPIRVDRLRSIKRSLSVRSIDLRDIDREISIYTDLRNASFDGTWKAPKYSVEDTRSLFESCQKILDPELCLVVEVAGAPAGMAVAIPSLSEALRSLWRRPWPMNLVFAALERRRPAEARLTMFAVLPKYRASGAQIALAVELLTRLRDKGYSGTEASLIVDENRRADRFLNALGFRREKRWRVLEKRLNRATV